MSASSTSEDSELSSECTLAKHPDYTAMHDRCRQTKDVPLHHSTRILLQARCRCSCHRPIAGAS